MAASSVSPVTQFLPRSVSHAPWCLCTSLRRREDRSIASRSDCPVDVSSTSEIQGRYSEYLNYGMSSSELDKCPVNYYVGHMACLYVGHIGGHLLPWIHGLSLSALDTLPVTYYPGHMACTYYVGHIAGHLLPWIHGLSLSALDTLPVTYCHGHIAAHLLLWTHYRSLPALDT
jgi:hypothetical protein